MVKAYFGEKSPDILWQAFQQGDKTAFEKIYRSYAKDLLSYGYKVTADRMLIEDSIQDLFIEIWRNRENLSATSSIKFYLFKALRYKIIRNCRARDMSPIGPLDQKHNDASDCSHENYLIELELQSIQLAHLTDVVGKLPKRQQEAINLRYYHNFSNEEIADIMEVNYQSACKFIYSALKNLKLTLKAPFDH